MATYITDHVERARNILIEQYKDKENILAIVDAFSTEIQELEDAFYQLRTERSINTAVGVQLDGLGEIVGRARNGADDETYRIRLRAQILLNLYSGTIPHIIEILTLVTQGENVIEIKENFPAAFTTYLDGQLLVNADELFSILKQAKVGGVRIEMIYQTTDTPFIFASGDILELDLEQGYGSDSDPTVGGDYVGVLGDG